MIKSFAPFFLSLFLHGLLIFFSRYSTPPYALPLRTGEPFEISKQGTGSPSIRNGSKGEVAPGASPNPPAPAGVTAGITDGSEFGISKPRYPESARLRGEEGKVLLKLKLDSAGALVKVEVTESSGYPDLDRSALLQVEKDLPPSNGNPAVREHQIQFNFILSRGK